jgi:hypothetical protein
MPIAKEKVATAHEAPAKPDTKIVAAKQEAVNGAKTSDNPPPTFNLVDYNRLKWLCRKIYPQFILILY